MGFLPRGLWEGLQSFGMVESQREIGGHTTREVRFYLASISPDAKNFASWNHSYLLSLLAF